jgi:hypothetical protein
MQVAPADSEMFRYLLTNAAGGARDHRKASAELVRK